MITTEQAENIRTRYNRHDAARNNIFPGKCPFTPAEMDQLPPRPDNDEIGQLEDYDWRTNPPDRYFLYVKENDHKRPILVTNWTGITLGTITSVGQRQTCYTPSGGWYQKQAITFKGTNGYEYHGWYHCSNGTYARVRMSAESKRKLQRTKAAA